MMTRFSASLCLLGAVAMSACSLSAQSPVGPSRKPELVPGQVGQKSSALPANGEVPAEVIEKLRADLVKRRNVDAAAVKVVSAQAVIWPDGGLGCAKPGEMVTQATVPGYRVELEADGRRYVYHAAQRGYFRLCDLLQGGGRDRLPVKSK